MLVDDFLKKLPPKDAIKAFIKARYPDTQEHLPLIVAVYLNCTSASEMLELTGRDAIRRLKSIYGANSGIRALEEALIKLNPSLDAPVFVSKGGGTCSRTTLWRKIHKVGHIALRRLAKKLMHSIAQAHPQIAEALEGRNFKLGVPFQRIGTTYAELQAKFEACCDSWLLRKIAEREARLDNQNAGLVAMARQRDEARREVERLARKGGA